MAELLDSSYRPVASNHSSQHGILMPCPGVTAAGRPSTNIYCTRLMFHLLGLQRAVRMRSRWSGTSGGRQHVAVLLMRHDIMWRARLPDLLPLNGVRVWLPWVCVTSKAREPRRPSGDHHESWQVSLSFKPENHSARTFIINQTTGERTEPFPSMVVECVRL